MRIALAGALAFLALYMVALRPKPPTADPAATPAPVASPESAPGKAAAQAQQAAGASQDSAAKHEQAADAASGEASGTAAPAQTQATDQAAGKPAGAIDVKIDSKTPKPSRVVLNDILDGKVAVLLFWDRKLSDDKAVHTAVKGLSRRNGKVTVHVASIRDLAQYEPITRGVPVVTSPTVLIIDRAGRARSVGGLTVPRELEELVGKALRVKP